MPASTELVVAHSSDLHLDSHSPFGHDAHTDRMRPLRQVIRAAEAVRADAIVLAGDVFEHNRLPLALLDRAARLMAEAGRPLVILPGNHDPLTPESVYRRGGLADPANVYVIGVSGELALFPELELEIWGRPHLDYGDMSPLAEPRGRTLRWQIATAHGHFLSERDDTARFKPSWLIHPDEIAATGADYVALGHWDRAVSVGTSPVPAYYSGSPQLARSVNVVRLGPDGGVRVTREPLADEAP